MSELAVESDQQQIVAMTRAASDLIDKHRAALVVVESTFSISASSKDAARTSLRLAKELIDTLAPGGWRYTGVLVGTYSFQKWAYQSQCAYDHIATATGSVAEWSMTSVLAGALKQTVDDVKQGARELESGAFPWAAVIVIGLVALLLLRVLG